MHLISDSGGFFHSEAFCSSVLLYSKVTASKGQLISHFTAIVYMVCHSGSERHSFQIYSLEMCRAFVPFSNYLSKFNIRVRTLLKMTVSQRMKERIVKLNNNPFFIQPSWMKLISLFLLEVVIKIRCANTGLKILSGLSVTMRGQRGDILYLYSGGSIFAFII